MVRPCIFRMAFAALSSALSARTRSVVHWAKTRTTVAPAILHLVLFIRQYSLVSVALPADRLQVGQAFGVYYLSPSVSRQFRGGFGMGRILVNAQQIEGTAVMVERV